MTDLPHTSWAEVYDAAYQHSFGDSYTRFTDATIDLIAARFPPPAKVVDFGAGTGRLAIPLASRGYAVTAVEPCKEMLHQLQAKDPQNSITTICGKMEDFSSDVQHDLALCVFTVISYLLDEKSLRKSLAAAHAALRPGGMLLLDIPCEAAFRGYLRRNPSFERTVTVTRQQDNLYTYLEELAVKDDSGELKYYRDAFPIRYWPTQQVIGLLTGIGFACFEDLTASFVGTGASYYLFQKPEHGDGHNTPPITIHP